MRVLLIEPDAVLSKIYCGALEADGHAVVATSSAQDAVHRCDQQQPDVVILELQLPHHNGVEFLYEFRSYSEWLNVPVIIHSFVPPSELAAAATLTTELGVSRLLYKSTTSLAQLCASVRAAAAVAT